MRILQINKFLHIVGGAETYMFQLSSALQKQGHEIQFWGMADTENIVSDFEGLLAENIDYSNQGIVSKITASINTIYSKKKKSTRAFFVY